MTVSRAMSVEVEPEEATSELHAGRRQPRGYDCDVCCSFFEGEPHGSGLFIWTRGDEVRYEEPPLCEECANRVTIGALLRFEIEEEEEG